MIKSFLNMKRILTLTLTLTLFFGAFAQTSIQANRGEFISVLQIPRYNSLANAFAAGARAGNVVYVYASADSGVYVRSMDNSRWIMVNGVGGSGSAGCLLDSVKIIAGTLWAYAAGDSTNIGEVGGGDGIGIGVDSSAYRSMTQVSDSMITINSLKRVDTVVVRVDKIDTFYRKPAEAKIYYQYAGVEYFVEDSIGPPSWKLNGGNTGVGNWIGTADENDFVIRRANEVIGSYGDNTLRFGYLTGTAPNSVFLGRHAGQGVSASLGNVHIGQFAGTSATNAGSSIFLGPEAGFQATNASNTIAQGYQAAYQATNADGSVFSGFMAGRGATGARVSIFSGWQAGMNATAATYCILMGRNVGSNFTGNAIGRNNMIFGLNISLPDSSTDRFNFGNVLYGTGTHNVEGGNPSITPTVNGRVGIRVVTPDSTLHINGGFRYQHASAGAGKVLTSDANGGASWQGGFRAFSQTNHGFNTNGYPTSTMFKVSLEAITSENVTVNTTDSVLVITQPGLYTIVATSSIINTSGSSILVSGGIYRNGSPVGSTQSVSMQNNLYGQVTLHRTFVLSLNDTISFRNAFSSTGTNITIESGAISLTRISN